MRVIRGLFVPHGVLFALALAFVPFSSRFRLPHLGFLSLTLIAIGVALSVRFRSPRGLLGAAALLALVIEVSWVPSTLQSVALASMSIVLALLLLVEDHALGFKPLAYWAVIVSAQLASVLGIGPRLIEHSTSLLACSLIATAALLAGLLHRAEPVLNALLWMVITFVLVQLAPLSFTWFGLVAASLMLVVSLLERAHRLAYHDELTGLPGRRAFNDAVAALEGSYCVAMVDVDHFKSFNDTFGHETGDQVLRRVAAALTRIGGQARAFRCGGEEFAILFCETDTEEASAHSESVRRLIAADIFVVRGPDRSRRRRGERRRNFRASKNIQAVRTRVTVSIGIAESSGNRGVADVIAAADAALYQAKENGRNRVEVAKGASKARNLKSSAKRASPEGAAVPGT